jgi:hypothetical protein
MLRDWAHSTLLSLLTACGANVERSAATPTAEVFGFSPNRCAPPIVGVRFDGIEDNETTRVVQRIVDADQAARTNVDFSKMSDRESRSVWAADRRRREELLVLLQGGKVNKPQSLASAALVFQHGNCPDHFLLANQLAKYAMNAGEESAGELFAATQDRWLMSQNKPQKFGTQYMHVNGNWILHEVDPNTTDDERRKYNVPTLAEAQAKADEMNRIEEK